MSGSGLGYWSLGTPRVFEDLRLPATPRKSGMVGLGGFVRGALMLYRHAHIKGSNFLASTVGAKPQALYLESWPFPSSNPDTR